MRMPSSFLRTPDGVVLVVWDLTGCDLEFQTPRGSATGVELETGKRTSPRCPKQDPEWADVRFLGDLGPVTGSAAAVHANCLTPTPDSRFPIAARFRFTTGRIECLPPEGADKERFWALDRGVKQSVAQEFVYAVEESNSECVLTVRPFGGRATLIPLGNPDGAPIPISVSCLSPHPVPNVPAHFRAFYRLLRDPFTPDPRFPRDLECATGTDPQTFPSNCPSVRMIFP
jgi:hypothetical protein